MCVSFGKKKCKIEEASIHLAMIENILITDNQVSP